jgi:hypothetical protein
MAEDDFDPNEFREPDEDELENLYLIMRPGLAFWHFNSFNVNVFL